MKTQKYRNSASPGFTIVELMVVVAIVSILAVIAMPAYLDYVVRSKVSEGMTFMAEAKTTVAEYYRSNNVMPVDNQTAGLPLATSYNRYDFVRRLEITSTPRPGTIMVTFKLPGSIADNKQLQLVPDTSQASIRWTCQASPAPDGLGANFAPPNCRG